jgi:hypothetical protein
MEKLLKALIKNTPLALVVIGLFLILIAAAGGWDKFYVKIPDVRWRIVLAVMGVVVAGFGALLVWRGTGEVESSALAKECKLSITAPADGAEVDGNVQMGGTYEKKPPDKRIVFIERSMKSGLYYFKKWPIEFGRDNKWSAECRVGGDPGTSRMLHVAVAGSGGQSLFDYFFRVVAETKQWPGIETLPPDIVFCDKVKVKRK